MIFKRFDPEGIAANYAVIPPGSIGICFLWRAQLRLRPHGTEILCRAKFRKANLPRNLAPERSFQERRVMKGLLSPSDRLLANQNCLGTKNKLGDEAEQGSRSRS